MDEKNEKKDYMLTTTDNPYSPFDDFDRWYAYDMFNGYHTCEYIGRIASPSIGLSSALNDEAYYDAIDEILKYNITGNYIKCRREDFPKKIKK